MTFVVHEALEALVAEQQIHTAALWQTPSLGRLGLEDRLRALGVDVVSADAGDGHYLVFITGPSRTADIELTAALGVHGPKSLYVWVVYCSEIRS